MWQDIVKRQRFVLQELVQLKREVSATQRTKIVNVNSLRMHLLYLSYSHLQFLLRSVLLIVYLKVSIT